MKTIILYGDLATRFGKYHRMAVKTAHEAIRALRANHRGFEQYMAGQGRYFRVFVGGSSLGDIAEIHHPAGEREIIRIVPVVAGAGSGWFKIFLGAALIAGGIALSVTGVGGPIGAGMIAGGLGLVVGGISQLLTTAPPAPGGATPSYVFSGPANTSAQGSPVPVGYGRLIIGSATVSAGITTSETY